MKLLTEDAVIRCDHQGTVKVETSQSWVTINGRKVLVKPDPVGRHISLCPNFNPGAGISRCTETLLVLDGYSPLIAIDGHPVVLHVPLKGVTNGVPTGFVNFNSIHPGQEFVDSV